MATETLTGTVYDDNNNAVSGATVTCQNRSTSEVVAKTTSNSSGRFTFQEATGSEYEVSASVSGYSSLHVTLEIEDGDEPNSEADDRGAFDHF